MRFHSTLLILSLNLPSGALELGRIETEQTRATQARHAEKLNPALDGWDTEAFSNAANAQLKKLGKLLSDPTSLTATSLNPLVSQKATTHPLLPKLTPTFQDSQLKVSRLPKSNPTESPKLLPELQTLATQFKNPRFKFKLFQVQPLSESEIRTTQFLALSDQFRELNATWSITWNAADTTIQSIRVTECELVERTQPRTLFTDATGSFVEKRPDLTDHLGHGINHWQGRIEKILSMHYFGHNGLAVGDVNGDGLDDLYLCQAAAVPNKLFLQQPDGTTREAAAEAGVDLLNSSRGCLLVDLDNDGDQDLALTIPYATLILKNDGTGKFTLAQRIDSASGGYSLTAVDYDNDSDLDLYVCVYYRKPGDASALAYPIPYHDANNGGQNILLRNDDMNFVDATEESGMMAENHRFSFAASWEDVDADGDLDVYVANDYGRNNLYRNQLSETGKPTFTSDAAAPGIEDTSFGMSVCWGDANADGFIDLYTGNMFSGAGNRIAFQDKFQQHAPGEIKAKLQRTARGNSLFLNNRDATFTDVTMTAGARQGRWAWGSIFADLNNDGLEDLAVANGFVTGKREDDL
ncbi:MAG: FG-GAP repeat domain-containing protein [Akkermansiaceae bacterium]